MSATKYLTIRNFDNWISFLLKLNYLGATNNDGSVSECRTLPHGQGDLAGRFFHKTNRGWLQVPTDVRLTNVKNVPRPMAGGYNAPRRAT